MLFGVVNLAVLRKPPAGSGALSLNIEPVYGCANKCPQCSFGRLPSKFSFLSPRVLDASLRGLPREAFNPDAVNFTLRGDPLSHPSLSKLTGVVRRRFPQAEIKSFWGLTSAGSEANLRARTKGLDELMVSLDLNHYAALRRLLPRREGEPHKAWRGRVLESLRDRVNWALNASEENGFKVRFHLVGPARERGVFKKVVRGVFEERGLAPNARYFKESERLPAGSAEGGDTYPYWLNIFHDGKVRWSGTP